MLALDRTICRQICRYRLLRSLRLGHGRFANPPTTVAQQIRHDWVTSIVALDYFMRFIFYFYAYVFSILFSLFRWGKLVDRIVENYLGMASRASFRNTTENILVFVLDNVLIILGLFWRIAKSIRGEGGGALRVRNLVMQFFRATNSTKWANGPFRSLFLGGTGRKSIPTSQQAGPPLFTAWKPANLEVFRLSCGNPASPFLYFYFGE